ncbi:MAG: hypothetical protein A2234_05715 [Elusimicrobia bacterium RIFOXYA2_FULL_58_8]|nr:MAG: hypothetical protein A2234_05715 [Elusimicrobia bacterium RIFOXYA2_FULL_58_8]
MKLRPLNDLPVLAKAAALSGAAGFELYAVGGCARDWAMGRAGADVDFLVSGDAAVVVEALAREYGGKYQKFGPFQTVRFFPAAGGRLDFARFRKETYQRPAALPVTVPAVSVQEDLGRRDFACNAMAVRLDGPEAFELADPHSGMADIRAGIVRVLHAKSFEDDPTRLYRAARFAGRFGWRLDADTAALAAAAVAGGLPGLLSRERLRNELLKILGEKDPLPALSLLRELGALGFIHKAFSFNGEALAGGTSRQRLAGIARLMGADAKDFVAGLNLSRRETAELLELAGWGKA